MASIAPAMGDGVAHSENRLDSANVEKHWNPQGLEHFVGSVLNVPTCSNSGTMQKRTRAKRRKNDSLSATLCAAIVKHQLGKSTLFPPAPASSIAIAADCVFCAWPSPRNGVADTLAGLSINCILLLTLTHLFFPRLRPRTTHYFVLSYFDEQTGLYNQGWDDLKLVSLWIIIFTALRAAIMDYVLVPIARSVGITKKKATIRFAEQAWLLVYYSVFWTWGAVLCHTTPSVHVRC